MANPFDQFDAAPASPARNAPAPARRGPAPATNPFDQFDPARADQKAPPPAAAPLTLTAKNLKGKTVTFQVPAGSDDAAIRRAAARAVGEPRYMRAVVNRPAQGQAEVQAAPDDHSAISGILAGAMKPIDKAAEWLSNTSVGRAIDRAGVAMGFPSTAEANAAHDEWRRNNDRTGYQMLGNIASSAAITRGRGLVTGGAISGALNTDSHDLKGTVRDAAIGAGTSYLGGKTLQTIGGIATGVKNQGAQFLRNAGVPLTLGQIGRAANNLPGRIVAGLEDRAAGIPLIGDIINAARDRGITGLNAALGNRVLANVGEKLPAGTAPGHATVDAIGNRLSTRYQQLVPNLRGQIDMQAAQGFTAARDLADQASRGSQLEGVIKRVFGGRLNGQNPTGATISGQQLKDAESELTRLYSKYKNAQGDEGLYGDAINMVRQTLRDMVVRSNPSHAAELKGLNTAWAQLATMRAAIRAGSDATKASGILTPGAALRVTARQGYRDPLLEAATEILPNRVPDSGTAGRAALLLGGGALGGAAVVDPREHPILAGSLAGVAALNTRAGQRALGSIALGSRPAAIDATGEAVKRLSRYAPALVAPAAVGANK